MVDLTDWYAADFYDPVIRAQVGSSVVAAFRSAV